jgi:hypothetical protein
MEVRAAYVLTGLAVLFTAAAVFVGMWCTLEVLYIGLIIANAQALLTALVAYNWTKNRLKRDGERFLLVANRESYPAPVKFLIVIAMTTLTTSMVLRWLAIEQGVSHQWMLLAVSYSAIGTLLGVLGPTMVWERRRRRRVPLWRWGKLAQEDEKRSGV